MQKFHRIEVHSTNLLSVQGGKKGLKERGTWKRRKRGNGVSTERGERIEKPRPKNFLGEVSQGGLDPHSENTLVQK